MALMHLNFSSHFLSGNTEISVLLPDLPGDSSPAAFYSSGKKYPVLWLLHGAFGDHTDWVRKTGIELYARKKKIIVVMPSGLNAAYANWPEFGPGYRMFDYLAQELMPLICGWFPASSLPADNYIAGLSMGGQGTCLYAFNHPELFHGAAVFSSSPREISWMREHDPHMFERTQARAVLNHGSLEAYENSYENAWKVLKDNVEAVNRLKLYFACGTADECYPAFAHFEQYALGLGLQADFDDVPGYGHEWPFWDLCIRKALDLFLEDT